MNIRETNLKKMQFIVGEPNIKFKEAFPEVEDIDVLCVEEGPNVSQFTNKSEFDSKNLKFRPFKCSNKSCKNGGFDIGKVVREMIRNREKNKETFVGCSGSEYTRGREIRGCRNLLRIKVDMKYNS